MSYLCFSREIGLLMQNDLMPGIVVKRCA